MLPYRPGPWRAVCGHLLPLGGRSHRQGRLRLGSHRRAASARPVCPACAAPSRPFVCCQGSDAADGPGDPSQPPRRKCPVAGSRSDWPRSPIATPSQDQEGRREPTGAGQCRDSLPPGAPETRRQRETTAWPPHSRSHQAETRGPASRVPASRVPAVSGSGVRRPRPGPSHRRAGGCGGRLVGAERTPTAARLGQPLGGSTRALLQRRALPGGPDLRSGQAPLRARPSSSNNPTRTASRSGRGTSGSSRRRPVARRAGGGLGWSCWSPPRLRWRCRWGWSTSTWSWPNASSPSTS